jgi:hypothetical protein
VTAAGGRGVPVVCDHTDDRRVAVLERVRAGPGGLDVLVNDVRGGYAAYHEDRHADLRATGFLDLSNSESPEFAGRAVVALAGDPAMARHTGRRLVAAELTKEYGFTDVDGARRAGVRPHFRERAAGG